MVTSCGIQTAATAVIVESTLSAVIQYSGATEFCDGDSVVLFTESSGNNILWEPVNSIDSAITVFESGTYTLTVSDNSGCTAVDAIDITVTPDTIIPELVLSPGNVLCNDQSLTISVVANAGSSVQWLSPLSGNSLSQVINSAGTYSCIITSCGVPTQQSVTVTAATVVAAITANGDIVFCEGDSVNLTSATAAESYLWQSATTDTIDISDSIAITVFESGNYLLTVADTNGCTATDSITVNAVENNLSVPLVSDTAICPGGYAILIATASGEINWYDIPSGGSAIATGATYTTPVLTTDATYYVMQQDEFCESEKAPVTVVIADCETITVPNVFTPNGDGVNDEYTFPIVGATCFNCKIYNRWGRLLYEWTDATKGWDGTNQRTGNVVNDGTYFYVLNWCSATAAQKEEAGFIQLLK
jgi:gliding motility-associated-like protein